MVLAAVLVAVLVVPASHAGKAAPPKVQSGAPATGHKPVPPLTGPNAKCGEEKLAEQVQVLKQEMAAHKDRVQAAAAEGAASTDLDGLGNTLLDLEQKLRGLETANADQHRVTAEIGCADGENEYGLCFYRGQGVVRDSVEAAKWFRKAAEQGHARAQFHLGAMYRNGEGVEHNETTAVGWFRKSATGASPCANAQNEMGMSYHRGDGVPKDDVVAAEWYGKAAELGLADGMNMYGWVHQVGFSSGCFFAQFLVRLTEEKPQCPSSPPPLGR